MDVQRNKVKPTGAERQPFAPQLLAMFGACLLAHYMTQFLMLPLGGRPNLADLTSFAINSVVLLPMLMLGYFTRRLLLVVSITVVLLLAFIVPSMLSLRGTALQALMQFVTYIGLPSLAYGFYVLICRASHLPLVAAIRERR